jgi:hypothetical protein
MHAFGIMNSIWGGTPGFVSDEYLNAISAETTTTALELCAANVWERVEGGYNVLDRSFLDMATLANREIGENMLPCYQEGEHRPDPENPEHCTRCGGRADAPPRKPRLPGLD